MRQTQQQIIFLLCDGENGSLCEEVPAIVHMLKDGLSEPIPYAFKRCADAAAVLTWVQGEGRELRNTILIVDEDVSILAGLNEAKRLPLFTAIYTGKQTADMAQTLAEAGLNRGSVRIISKEVHGEMMGVAILAMIENMAETLGFALPRCRFSSPFPDSDHAPRSRHHKPRWPCLIS